MEDEKLKTEKRNSLPDTSFCGPGRSFPVHNCAHYTAALRLLNRAKVSEGTKSKIHACVMRKGKSLGCGTKDAATDAEIEALIESEDFASTREFLEWLEGADSMPANKVDFI